METPKAIEIMDLNIKAAKGRMPPDVKDAIETLIKCAYYVIATEAVLTGENSN